MLNYYTQQLLCIPICFKGKERKLCIGTNEGSNQKTIINVLMFYIAMLKLNSRRQDSKTT